MKELGEILTKALANNGQPIEAKKLLTYLKEKMLIDWKPKVSLTKPEDKAKIEKQIETDLNYLNVFVQPIGEINIFQ